MELLALISIGLRILTLVVGMVDFGITVDSYLHHYKSEEFFLSIVIICLFVSLFFELVLFGSITGYLKRSHFMKFLDFSFHILAALFLMISGIVFLVSVVRFGSGKTPIQKAYYSQRWLSGIFGIFNSVFYFNICWMLWFVDDPTQFRKRLRKEGGTGIET